MRLPHPARFLLPALALSVGLVGCKADRNHNGQSSTLQNPGTSGQTSSTSNPDQKSDQALTTSVQAKMFADRDLKQANIDVSTNNQVVTLSGTVPDAQVKDEAARVARSVDGVKSVDDKLRVGSEQPAATTGHTDEASATNGQAAGAGWITAKIQAQYFADSTVKGSKIDVGTTNGVVTLTGKVDSDAVRTRAVQIAKDTPGVKRVDDELQVATQTGTTGQSASAQPPAAAEGGKPPLQTDEAITTRIQSRYFTTTDLAPRDIDVSTNNGVVTLKGDVRTDGDRQEALTIAKAIPGVKSVDDELRVNAQVAGTSGRMPVVAPAPSRESGAAAAASQPRPGADARDDQIRTRIQSAYYLSDAVSDNSVAVQSQDGVVTLSGTVASQAAKQQALDIAKNTEGVSRVIDNIAVRNDGR